MNSHNSTTVIKAPKTMHVINTHRFTYNLPSTLSKKLSLGSLVRTSCRVFDVDK